ncbi:MAG: chromosome partitioning protein [Actinomycetota bacterium]|nr:chromosome partitioning protein [Actinomycetota bacterium]
MSLPILTAVTDASWEADLVAGLDGADLGVTVVRRCVDLADLLAAAATRTAEAVVLSAYLRRLDREALGRLEAAGLAVLGLVEPGDEPAERRLRQLGLPAVLPTDAGPAAIAEALQAVVTARAVIGQNGAAGLLHHRPEVAFADGSPAEGSPADGGRIVAVWGPAGAPGRTTVAISLADESARLGLPTLLVDADTYGGAVAQVLGFLDEAPGLAAAARLAGAGRLDVASLAGLARTARPWLRVLTGIARPDRWPELPGSAVHDVLAMSRRLAAIVVVDCGFSLEQDEELVYDTSVPRRNAATIAAIEAADEVLAVGAADPVGMHRLVRGLSELAAVRPEGKPRVVLNKLRRGLTPGDPAVEAGMALRRHAGILDSVMLPYERAGLDRALGAGRTLAEVAPNSPLRRALAGLAGQVAALPQAGGRRRGRRVG